MLPRGDTVKLMGAGRVESSRRNCPAPAPREEQTSFLRGRAPARKAASVQKQIRDLERTAGVSAMHMHTPIVGMSCAHPADPLRGLAPTRRGEGHGSDDEGASDADDRHADEQDYFSGGMDDYLKYPISQVDVVAKVRKWAAWPRSTGPTTAAFRWNGPSRC